MKRLIAITLVFTAGAFAAVVALKPICAECGTSDSVVVAEDVTLELDLKVYICENCGIYYIRDARYPSYKWYSDEDIPAVKAEYARLDAERTAAREDKTSRLNAAGWPDDTIDRVLRRQIKIGDSTEIVREAWGPPDETRQEDTPSGIAEIWIYEAMLFSRRWVRFENGKVNQYQNHTHTIHGE
jgi:hypothetical protein